MAEEPTPQSPPEPTPKRVRSPLNKAQEAELNKAEQIGRTSQKAAYAGRLAAREIISGFVNQLLADAASARTKSADALHSTTGKTSASLTENNAEANLVVAIQEIQAAARQKYARTQPEKLRDYFIGQKLTGNRPMLEGYSQAIIDKLATDTLPGITPEKVANLGTLRAASIAANATQGGAQSDATTGRTDLDAMVQSIKDRRMEIQFAADAEWPYTKPGNAGVRKEFYLPSDRPFSVPGTQGTPPPVVT